MRVPVEICRHTHRSEGLPERDNYGIRGRDGWGLMVAENSSAMFFRRQCRRRRRRRP